MTVAELKKALAEFSDDLELNIKVGKDDEICHEIVSVSLNDDTVEVDIECHVTGDPA